MLLLQRVDELETNEQSTNVRIIDLEVTTNATTKGLTELGNVVNVTTEIVEEHEIDIQGKASFSSSSFRLTNHAPLKLLKNSNCEFNANCLFAKYFRYHC